MDRASLAYQTDSDFAKARNIAFFNEIAHFLNPEEAHLISFSDMKKLLKPGSEVYKGMQVVPVKLIVGSEGRYRDFDNRFFPKSNFLRTRWESVDSAHYEGVVLPPISLYELGGLYFVRDGNHRVSVARMQGVENIDAEVVSLQSEIKLKPGSTMKQIIRQVIDYEKRVFYTETAFGDITDYWSLNFTTTGQYDVIYNHILVHKYYINMSSSKEIPMPDAILSWFNNVYLPVINAIQKQKIMRDFRGRSLSDLYVFLIKYWDDLKKQYGQDYPLTEAAESFPEEYKAPSPFSRALRKIQNKFYRLKMKKTSRK